MAVVLGVDNIRGRLSARSWMSAQRKIFLRVWPAVNDARPSSRMRVSTARQRGPGVGAERAIAPTVRRPQSGGFSHQGRQRRR